MNYGPVIFLSALVTMACSWLAFVFGPAAQLGKSDQSQVLGGGNYPVARSGIAQQGAEVYRANGCQYCHSQQVRPASLGADIARGWGKRRSVAADFIYDYPVMPGNLRHGPDLADVGSRLPDMEWHLLHLYNPQSVLGENQKSVMPPYRYLFVQRKIGRAPSPNALKLTGKVAPPTGFEVVPTDEAYALVHYLLSLRLQGSLYEAPLPIVPGSAGTNTSASATNAVANGTNAPTATNTLAQ